MEEHAVRGLPGPNSFDTIFVGGGTPTLLEHQQLERLLTWLRGLLTTSGELTIECNPETVTRQLAALLATTATRVSVGAQSTNPSSLAVLERRATPEQIHAAVTMLRDAGVRQLNLDVIWGIPGQTESDLQRDLARLLDLQPDHVSAYELDFKPGTRLTRTWGSREAAVGEVSDHMYELVAETIVDAGFQWYETANFARQGSQCRHNTSVWRGEDYAGIGIGAVGTITASRRRNRPSLPRYLEAAIQRGDAPHDTELLSDATRSAEHIMLGLRLQEGVHVSATDAAVAIDHDALEWLTSMHMIEGERHTDGSQHLQLTKQGRFLANDVVGRLLRWPEVEH